MGKLIVELPDELHMSLKRQANMEHKTLKLIVTSLLGAYLRHPSPVPSRNATGLCGAWKDRREARQLLRELRSARRWRMGTNDPVRP